MSRFLRASRYFGSSWSCRRMMICCSMMWLQAKANLNANLRSPELMVWFMQRKRATKASGKAVRYSASNSSYAGVLSRTARYPKWKNCVAIPSSRAFRKRPRSLRSTLSLISAIELRISGFRFENSRPRSSSKGLRDSSNLAMTRSMSAVNLKVYSFSGTGGVLTRGSQSLSTTSARSSQKCVKEEWLRTTDFLGFSPSKIEFIWYWQRLSSDCICRNTPYSHPSITRADRRSIGPTQHTHARKIKTLKNHVGTVKGRAAGEKPKRGASCKVKVRYGLLGSD